LRRRRKRRRRRRKRGGRDTRFEQFSFQSTGVGIVPQYDRQVQLFGSGHHIHALEQVAPQVVAVRHVQFARVSTMDAQTELRRRTWRPRGRGRDAQHSYSYFFSIFIFRLLRIPFLYSSSSSVKAYDFGSRRWRSLDGKTATTDVFVRNA